MNINELSSLTPVLILKVALVDGGGELYVVGGSIRDALLHRPITDLDFVVRNLSSERVELLLEKIGPVNLVGKKFAVFKTKIDNYEVDVALPRTERAGGSGGHFDVHVHADSRLPIEQDLGRRDFTVNAMAWNVVTHDLIDPFNGRRDGREKIIRTVGEATSRFQEDAVRMLRAVRLAAQLGFQINEAAVDAIIKNGHVLEQPKVVPKDMIRSELTKGFHADAKRMLQLLQQTNILRALTGGLLHDNEIAPTAASGLFLAELHTLRLTGRITNREQAQQFSQTYRHVS